MTDEQNNIFEKRIHVPWMNLDEWKKVYECVYSKDIELQKRGYERLILWKARQNQLPSGIDCTLELIHIRILDEEITDQISKGVKTVYAEYDLQLMNSAAITRFLNHVSNVVKTQKDTMFDMAKSLNIPNWFVSLRHDGAHSTSLPSLSVLRMGVQFALEWLHENYWKLSATIPSLEFSKTESRFSNKQVGKILEIWQSVRMYQINGYFTMQEIPDDNLRSSIVKLLKTGFQEDSESFTLPKNKSNLSQVIHRVQKKLLVALRGGTRNENLIAMLLESETFIPPTHFISKKYSKDLTESKILEWISSFWGNILVVLQENFSLFPVLVHKLLIQLNEEKSEHRQLVMALWIKQLCISMLKSQTVLKEAYKTSSNIIKDDIYTRMTKKEKLKPKIDVTSSVLEEVEEKYPHLKDGYFVLQNDDANFCPVSDLEIAVLNPNEFTSVFLSSLMDVTRPVLQEKRKRLLEELVSIAVKNTGVDSDIDDAPECTINEFYQKLERKKIKLDTHSTNHVDEKVEFDSEYNWSTCPLGVLPWQRESLVTLDIPSDIKWELSENSAPDDPTFNVPLITTAQKEVNWKGVLKNISKARAISKKKRQKVLKKKRVSQLLAH